MLNNTSISSNPVTGALVSNDIIRMAFAELKNAKDALPFPTYIVDEERCLMNDGHVKITVKHEKFRGFKFYVDLKNQAAGTCSGCKLISPYFTLKPGNEPVEDRVVLTL